MAIPRQRLCPARGKKVSAENIISYETSEPSIYGTIPSLLLLFIVPLTATVADVGVGLSEP